MYQQAGDSLSRKRERYDENESDGPQGFQEHRAKRQLSSLPFRRSPELIKSSLPSLRPDLPPQQNTTFADITPAGSDSDNAPSICEPRSYFSSCSSSPETDSFMGSSQPSSYLGNTAQDPDAFDRFASSDDMEMTESGPLYPPTLNPDLSNPVTSRVPTPIHASFSHPGRPTDKIPTSIRSGLNNFDAMGRRLPSPISEDEKEAATFSSSPPENDVCMKEREQDMLEGSTSPLKKGGLEIRHSMRSWGAYPSDSGDGSGSLSLRRGFSMGYRGDCDKCRSRVPGHFSHVINY